MSDLPVTDLFRALDLTGVFANAMLGGVIARREKLDPVGFAVLAILSGLGGGLIRDTLLQRGTPIALTDYAYLLTAVGGAALTFLIRIEGPVWDRAWPVIDALALGCWAARLLQRLSERGLAGGAGRRGRAMSAHPLARLDPAGCGRVVTGPGRARPPARTLAAEQPGQRRPPCRHDDRE